MPHLTLKPKHLVLLHEVLAQHASGLDVWAHGTRVTDDNDDDSALNIVLRNPTNLETRCDEHRALIEALRECGLPMYVDVMDWSTLPESLRNEIEDTHLVLQTGKPTSA